LQGKRRWHSLRKITHLFRADSISDDKNFLANSELQLSDEWADTQMAVDGAEGCLRAFVQLKQQYSQMRVILSVGGGGKGSEHFAATAHSRTKLETFVRSARQLVDQYGLDGIDGKS
jgi:GH18 family chitinase